MSKIVPKIVEKPWGREIIWADIPVLYMGKTIVINEGHKLSKQYHEFKAETIHVIDGILKLEIGEHASETICGGKGLTYHIPPKTIHRFCAHNGPVTILEVSTYFPNDIVRLSDDYGRA